MFTQDKVQDAFHFAALEHGDQKYVCKPYSYLVHISLVAFEIANAIVNAVEKNIHLDNDLAILCAILHDVIEDTNADELSIRDKFGESIANGVLALTKNNTIEDKELRMKDSLERIKHQPKEIWMVKMADRITNLQPPPSSWSNDKAVKYGEDALLIYNELKEADEFLANRLYEKIHAYDNY